MVVYVKSLKCFSFAVFSLPLGQHTLKLKCWAWNFFLLLRRFVSLKDDLTQCERVNSTGQLSLHHLQVTW